MTPLLLILSALAATAGDYYGKRWANGDGRTFLYVSLLAYELVCPPWLYLMGKGATLSREGVIWSVLVTATAVALGVGVFGETLTRVQWAGAIMAVVAIGLLAGGGH